MATPFDDWKMADRCPNCFGIVQVTAADLKVDGDDVSWKCPTCEKVCHPLNQGRYPVDIKKHVAAGCPQKAPWFEPPKPWYKRFWAWLKRPFVRS